MARSNYIYIYLHHGMIVGAFTVKYECQNCIKNLDMKCGYVIRVKDGVDINQPDSLTYYKWDEFLGDTNV